MNFLQNQSNFQQQLYQFQYLKEQRDMFSNQLELMNVSYNNLLKTKKTVENLKDLEAGEEILVPIGGLVYVKANLKQKDNVLVSISDDVVIEKNIGDTGEFIDSLIEQHKTQIEYLQKQVQAIEMNLQQMSQYLQQQQMMSQQAAQQQYAPPESE